MGNKFVSYNPDYPSSIKGTIYINILKYIMVLIFTKFYIIQERLINYKIMEFLEIIVTPIKYKRRVYTSIIFMADKLNDFNITIQNIKML